VGGLYIFFRFNFNIGLIFFLAVGALILNVKWLLHTSLGFILLKGLSKAAWELQTEVALYVLVVHLKAGGSANWFPGGFHYLLACAYRKAVNKTVEGLGEYV
jgi:hypothetical protein